MIDFACKKFDLNEIIKCSLNLTRTEFEVMKYLIINDEKIFGTVDLSDKLNIGLSTVQKALKKMKENDILHQSQKNIEGGGYYFTYKIKNKLELRKIIIKIVQKWSKKVEKEIEMW
jgi:predicted transcriptional regulator